MERATIWLSRIFDIFFDLAPKTQNFDFSKMNAYKDQNFEVFTKIGIHVANLHTNNTHAKFQTKMFIFGCAMIKNQVRVMTSLFLMQFLAFLIAVRKNK